MTTSDIIKKYQRLSPIEHILKRPGMYIGGIDPITDNLWVMKNNNIVEKQITFSPGLYKIFDEIIVNAYDQTIRDPAVTTIKVLIDKDKNEISVYNDGHGIDVIMHPKEKIYVPELLFGHLRTSTSFDETTVRVTGGIHGLGAKLTAIFSKYFKIETGDTKNKKSFSQIYKNNLSSRSEPVIKDYQAKSGYTKITFKPDLTYFGITGTMDNDFIALLERRVYDLAGLTSKNISVYLNNKKIPITNFNNYVNLYGKESQVQESCATIDVNFKDNRWRIILASSDGTGFKQVSFVNGIYTAHGGRHVEYIIGRVVRALKDYISHKYKTDKIKSQFIKDQLWLFLACVIENPTFSSQTKDEMMTPVDKFGSSCTLSDDFVKRIFKKFDFDTLISQQLNFMRSTELTKLDGKAKKKLKGIPKLYDANMAGTNRSTECTLILTEGDSAKTMAISGLAAIPRSNNLWGVFPLKGKLLNVREASHKQLVNNAEFINLKKIIGLQTNKVYDAQNLIELRYGSILLMMDADVDGSHIKGLFINLLHYYYPSLLKIKGFLKVFITPVVKITDKQKSLSFYNLDDYDKFVKKTDTRYTVKYYKGLGTNTAVEAREYFSNLDKHIIEFEWVESTDRSIALAFEKKQADARKEWLKGYDRSNTLDYTNTTVSYKDFIHKELIHFSNYDNIRSIPSIIDGLKPSQRKVLFGCFKRNLNQDIKVAQLVGYISEHSAYHHGETSLANTIIGMAQNFVGSNNINLLAPKGQFGTRLMGGSDHSSPRYIFTRLEEITRLIYHKDDDMLLTYLKDDGLSIEPEYYVPVIPMILINGSQGIGTGYSTFIPKFKPLDIIDALIDRLGGGKFKNMVPWYAGYRGEIVRKDKDTFVTKGLYRTTDKNNLLINELPITSWTEPYKIFLEETISEKPEVKSVLNNSNETNVDFLIKFNDAEYVNLMTKSVTDNKTVNGLEKMLGLARMINLGNMHAYNSSNRIHKYNTVINILDEFYAIRLGYYDKRKKYLLNRLLGEIKILESKVRFIDLVIGKKIQLFNKKKQEIIGILEKQKELVKLPDESPYDYLIRMSFYSLTKERIEELDGQLKDKTSVYDILKKKKIEQLWTEDLMALKEKLK
jgi:DNA topoisomerase-2